MIWFCSCAYSSAPVMISSAASSAAASTIMIALRVLATTMSIRLSSSCSNVGLTTYLPSM